MNGPSTLMVCNGCEFRDQNYKDGFDCGHPSVRIGHELDTIITSSGKTLVICPAICPFSHGRSNIW